MKGMTMPSIIEKNTCNKEQIDKTYNVRPMKLAQSDAFSKAEERPAGDKFSSDSIRIANTSNLD